MSSRPLTAHWVQKGVKTYGTLIVHLTMNCVLHTYHERNTSRKEPKRQLDNLHVVYRPNRYRNWACWDAPLGVVGVLPVARRNVLRRDRSNRIRMTYNKQGTECHVFDHAHPHQFLKKQIMEKNQRKR